MPRDVDLHAGEAALVPLGEQPLVYHLRVGDALPELVVHQAGVACQHGPGGLGPQPPVWPHLEAVGLDGPCPLSGEAGPAAELGEVAPLRVELASGLGGHRLQGLVYNFL